jgi:transcriptional regulator with XRE-family HTH domain
MSLIRAARTAAGLTMTETARRAGLRLTKLWKLEHGEQRVHVEDVVRLAHAIGCPPSTLLPILDEGEPLPDATDTLPAPTRA